MSEAAKAANRLQFGEVGDDADQSDLGYDTGMLGKGSSGHMRAEATKKQTIGLTKKHKMELARQAQRHSGGGITTIRGPGSGSGTASVAFTPVQVSAMSLHAYFAGAGIQLFITLLFLFYLFIYSKNCCCCCCGDRAWKSTWPRHKPRRRHKSILAAALGLSTSVASRASGRTRASYWCCSLILSFFFFFLNLYCQFAYGATWTTVFVSRACSAANTKWCEASVSRPFVGTSVSSPW